MKILYAIKDKYRGAEELVTWEGVPGTVAAWDNKYDAKSELPYLGDEAEVLLLTGFDEDEVEDILDNSDFEFVDGVLNLSSKEEADDDGV